MYSLYKEKCSSDGVRYVSNSRYSKVFYEEYNYSFHVPKKDQCQTCCVYRNKEEKGELTNELKTGYEEHIKRKDRARDEKNADKLRAKQDHSFHVATFDLEAVLPVPCSLVSQVYYKRKLSCYNLSFYSLKKSSSTCFLWNESDSIHAAVERAKKCTSVYVPSERDTIVRMARKRNPYVVVPMKHYDFLDIKNIARSVLPPKAVGMQGQRIQWMKVRWIKLQKDEPGNIYFKYSFDDQQFQCIKIKSSRKGLSLKSDLQSLYTAKLPIAAAKIKDLLSLCSDGTIPTEYHQYYKDIHSEKTARDCLPEPDTVEESENSDVE